MLAALPEAEIPRVLAYEEPGIFEHGDQAFLAKCWMQVGCPDFDESPTLCGDGVDDDTSYEMAISGFPREGVLSVVREILAERGEG